MEERKVAVGRLVFSLALSGVAVLCFLYAYNIYRWSQIPDFGFGFRTATGIEVVGIVNEHGSRSGLAVGDRILAVNGQRPRTYLDFQFARHWDKEGRNNYLIEREGRQLSIDVPNVPLGFKRVFKTSGFTFMLGLGFVVIGSLVYLMKPGHKTSRVFFGFGLIFGLFVTFLYKTSFMQPLWMESVVILAYTFTPASFVHLALTFPQERLFLKKYPQLGALPYLVSLVLFLGIRLQTPTMFDAPQNWLASTVSYMALSVLLFLGSALHLRWTSRSIIIKLRSEMVLLGFALAASLPLIDFLFNSLLKMYLVPNFNYYLPFFLVFPAFVAYSIVKHDLFDIDTIIKRTYGYVLTTGILAGLYGGFVLGSNVLFGRLDVAQSRLVPLVFILVIVFFFNPLRDRIQRLIDRLFYRLEYDYQETVQKISESMRSLLKLDEIGARVMETALGTMFIDTGSLLLVDRQQKNYDCLLSSGTREVKRSSEKGGTLSPTENPADAEAIPADAEGGPANAEAQGTCGKPEAALLTREDPFIIKLEARKKEVTIYDVQEDPYFADARSASTQIFEKLDATLIVPLIYEDRLIGLIALGRKKSGKFYRREDINLLNTLANQGAVAIENALMVEEVIEKERMEEELNIAKDLQTSMLPAACPQVEGFGLAAFSEPAREVGGDFYDFVETRAGGLGIVIGDVTGKSVSGALVMSASRSIFRMLSEEDLPVGEIMVRANRRTKKDIKSGMFVALLYAVVDPRDRVLRLCSAGQTQPIHLSAGSGQARLVQTEGDTFPLGILPEVDYQETRLPLAPGDKVLLYTDGIVEAMNAAEEIFGFERLLAVVAKAAALSAEALLSEVRTTVDAFVGSAPQHDDLTVIVLEMK